MIIINQNKEIKTIKTLLLWFLILFFISELIYFIRFMEITWLREGISQYSEVNIIKGSIIEVQFRDSVLEVEGSKLENKFITMGSS